MRFHLAQPSFSALIRHFLGNLRRVLRGKPLVPRFRAGGRPINRGLRANLILADLVELGESGAVSRLGTTENAIVRHYVEHEENGYCIFPQALKVAIRELSGFFPLDDSLLSRFSQETIEHLREIDVLGVRRDVGESGFWSFEDFFLKRFSRRSTLVDLNALMPLGDPNSWTKSLKGKRVLVIHPFAETIAQQFEKRHVLFDTPDFLPDFELDVIQAVQSVGENSSLTGFTDWFEALESMKAEIAKRDFDVALIGAGAYGLFLASECKRMGKVGIHIGGATQLFFGILGRRWTIPESPDSASVMPFVNEHWVGPRQSEIPAGASKVEGGCYWM